MSFGLTMTLGAQRETATQYTVEHRGNCILVFGSVPATAFVALAKLAPKKAVFSTRLAHLAGCSAAMGLSSDVDRLSRELEPAAIARTARRYAGAELSDDVIRWLAIGHRGASSNAMLVHLAGYVPDGAEVDFDPSSHPHDPDDLSRCRLLVDQVPEIAPRLGNMSAVSPVWAALVSRWNELCETLDQETTCGRQSRGTAPRTYALMRQLIQGTLGAGRDNGALQGL